MNGKIDMIRIFISICLWATPMTIQALMSKNIEDTSPRTYTLPSAQEIERRFAGGALQYFAEKSRIAQKLGGKSLYALGIHTAIVLTFFDFCDYLQKDPENPHNSTIIWLTEQSLPDIYALILQDFPSAVDEIEKEGLLPKGTRKALSHLLEKK